MQTSAPQGEGCNPRSVSPGRRSLPLWGVRQVQNFRKAGVSVPRLVQLDHDAAVRLDMLLAVRRAQKIKGGLEPAPWLDELRAVTAAAQAGGGELLVVAVLPVPENADTDRTRAEPSNEVLTQVETALECGVSARTIRRWLDGGKLDHVVVDGVRRVPRSAIERLRPGRTVHANGN